MSHVLSELAELLPVALDGIVHSNQEHLGVHQPEAEDNLQRHAVAVVGQQTVSHAKSLQVRLVMGDIFFPRDNLSLP